MTNETLKLKIDLQHAIANNISEYSTSYNTLIFENEYKNNLEAFTYFKYLKIYIKDNKMYFDIELDEDEINELDKEDLQKIKNISNKVRYVEICEQISEHLKTDEQKEIERSNAENYLATVLEEADEDDEDDEEFVPAKKNNIERIKNVQFILDNLLNEQTIIEEQDLFFSINLVYKELRLNQDMLYTILLLSYFTDIIIIHPYYEDNEDLENENMIGVRLFFGIYKGSDFNV